MKNNTSIFSAVPFQKIFSYLSFKIYLLLLLSFFIGCTSSRFSEFVTADKDKLMEGDKELRFVSYNIPNLHYLEDYLDFRSSNPWRLPDEYEIRDALNSIKQLGGKVTRIYVLSVRKPGESKKIIRHIEAPGVFNEEAFQALDKVMQIANETGVRIIIPFIDNWWWWGGPIEYAGFRGKKREEFWTDKQLIDDFKKTINFLVNRRNIYTGTLYKDDKALLGWETGNELVAPFSWTSEIAAYIKSLDRNHLVIEGTHSSNLTIEAINDPNIDVLSTHHYTRAEETVKKITANREMIKNKKPYFIGEFGLLPKEDIKAIVDTTLNNDVSGIMAWSLRYHTREGGFYLHRENTGAGPYRFPGFASGNIYNEQEIINFLREKAFEIDNMPVPSLEVPMPPKLFEISNVNDIRWQGSTGASSYLIERAGHGKENWSIIADNISDADAAFKPIYSDTSASIGGLYYYRVSAKNVSGISDPSNISGPVNVTSKIMIDELKDSSCIFKTEGATKFLTFEDIYKAKEDHSRLQADSASALIYEVPNELISFKLFVFSSDSLFDINIFAGDNLDNYQPLNVGLETYPPYKNVYNFFTSAVLTCEEFPVGTKFVKIYFNHPAQISRTEIEYQ